MPVIDITCIIDDDPIHVFGVKRILTLSNFTRSCMIFKNGQEALDNLRPILISGTRVPEIILLDINMPIMDGWEFLEEFVKIPTSKTVTIYIVSSSIDPADIDRAKAYEAVSNYIIKPVTFESLKTIMADFTENEESGE
ncbi:response regulator [Bizionia sediminis]|uniref:Response regulator n=1 Tax=Bizionia sediminis TaxID=1737064 RepID=A0ABW5KUB7_9FLAO